MRRVEARVGAIRFLVDGKHRDQTLEIRILFQLIGPCIYFLNDNLFKSKSHNISNGRLQSNMVL